MVNEEEKKIAFRIAYNVLTARKDPEFTAEYFEGVFKEFNKLVAENKGNGLLPYLLLGVYEYLEKEAKGRSNT